MKLFKFKSAKSLEALDRDIQTMRNNAIWFSDLSNLNDPFEKVYSTKIFDEYVGNEEIVTDFFIPFQKEVDDYIKNVGIFSSCEKIDNLVLWSHYADNHKGYCIEYNLNEEEISSLNFDKKDEVFLFEVEYNDYPSDFLNFPSNFQFYFRYKSTQWKYENEFRFISSKYGPHKVPKNSIKAIYLGKFINNITKDALLNFGKEKNIAIYQVMLSNNSYELKFEQIL